MNRKLMTVTATILTAAVLSGCGSLFDKEYVAVKEYSQPVQESTLREERVTVRSFAGLKQALLSLAYSGESSGIIAFDQSYEGDPTEDMASACWQVRTQDALCAYCVENIAYDINKIVTINEANVYFSYSQYGVKAADIRRTYYSSGIENLVKEALIEGKHRIAVLVNNSSLSADDVAASVVNIYREHPTVVPREPMSNVTMFSGNGQQRLYDISIGYGMSDEEKDRRVSLMDSLKPFDDEDAENMSEAEKAYVAYNYLKRVCTVSDTAHDNTAYAALIEGTANSEGIAFAYVALCNKLDIECKIVYGQRQWEDHCWNIVKIDGDYYHVDVSRQNDDDSRIFANDEHFWGEYRWDVASYPKCTGDMQFEADKEK